MESGYYMFDCQIVNRGIQSAVAMAAYRSDEKLYSERDGLTKSYKAHSVKPESFILSPDHAPSWTNNREKLWNNVERYENRENARIARNVLMPLPKELTREQQTELTKDFVQENFTDEGMVADVSIHRDEEHNPHAHVLLTVRPFKENGDWENHKSKRVPVLDKQGNQVYNEKGWKKTRSVKINDWDNKDTLKRWRENWAEKMNDKAKEYGINKTYSHQSYKDQGLNQKGTHRLTINEYQLEEKVKNDMQDKGETYTPQTYYAKKNEQIKEYNKNMNNVIHLKDYRTEKDYDKYLHNIRKSHVTDDHKIAATKKLVERVKGYVDYNVASKLYQDFHSEQNKWKLKIERHQESLKAEKQFYNELMNSYMKNYKSVEKYGYNVDSFKEQIKNDINEIQHKEEQQSKEIEKFNELKDATKAGLNHQKELVNLEFKHLYEDNYKEGFSTDEKAFAINLLKNHSIYLPLEKIKNEWQNSKEKEYDNRQQIPVWKQAKDMIASIAIYDRTISKFNRMDESKLSPDQLKNEHIKARTMLQLKQNYQGYLQDIEPMLHDKLNRSGFDKVNLNNLDIQTKAAMLEEYSKLPEHTKKSLNVKSFAKQMQEDYEEKGNVASGQMNKADNEQEKNAYQDISSRAKDVSDGLISIINELDQTHQQDNSKSAKPKRSKKAKRRRHEQDQEHEL